MGKDHKNKESSSGENNNKNFNSRRITASWKNNEQAESYVNVMNNTISFLVGAPGTGKTFIAIATALELLLTKKIQAIYLTRPAVTIENYGFLPGAIEDKMDPYIKNIQKICYSLIGKELYDDLVKKDRINICPLGFMQGMTFTDEVVIVDEAENMTAEQMYIMLTRIGYNCKMIFTGDCGQIFIKNSGFMKWVNEITHLDEVVTIKLTEDAIVRHPIVKEISKIWRRNNNIE